MIGQAHFGMAGQARLRDLLQNPANDLVPQGAHMGGALAALCRGQPEGFGKADDVGHVLGAGPQPKLLPAAGLRRQERCTFANVQRTDTLGTIELVGAQRQQVHA